MGAQEATGTGGGGTAKWATGLAIASAVIAVASLVLSLVQTNVAREAYAHDRDLTLRTSVSRALSEGEAAYRVGQRLLSGVRAWEATDKEHLYEIGQKFEDQINEAERALNEAQYLTAHLPFSGSLEASRQRLFAAQQASAVLFTSVPPSAEERAAKIKDVDALWHAFAEALDDARVVSYCSIPLDGEGEYVKCPRTPSVAPTR